MAFAPQASGNPDKVIIFNKSGMMAKYTAAGVANIYAALARLVAAAGLVGSALTINGLTVGDTLIMKSWRARE